MAKPALIIVDVQNDFCPGGALAVPEGDQIIPIIQAAAEDFQRQGLPIVTTQDNHPPHHVSFAERGGPWPPHCVQGTSGFSLHPALQLPPHAVCLKGEDPDQDAYSGFEGLVQGVDGSREPLASFLHRLSVDTVYVTGLATDYCVRATVLDALQAGFRTVVLKDAIRGVDVNPGDSERALEEMAQQGADIR